jgi:hypothetical protein
MRAHQKRYVCTSLINLRIFRGQPLQCHIADAEDKEYLAKMPIFSPFVSGMVKCWTNIFQNVLLATGTTSHLLHSPGRN